MYLQDMELQLCSWGQALFSFVFEGFSLLKQKFSQRLPVVWGMFSPSVALP